MASYGCSGTLETAWEGAVASGFITVPGIRNASLNTDSSPIDVSTRDDSCQANNLYGLYNVGIDIDGIYPGLAESGIQNLVNSIVGKVVLPTKFTDGFGTIVSGNFIVSNFTANSTHDGVWEYSASFALSSGAVTIT